MIVKLRMTHETNLTLLEVYSVSYVCDEKAIVFGVAAMRVIVKGVSPPEYQCYLEELYDSGALDLSATALHGNWVVFE